MADATTIDQADLAISYAAEWGRAWYAHEAGDTAYRPLPDYGRNHFLATTSSLSAADRLFLLTEGWPAAPADVRRVAENGPHTGGLVRLDSLPLGTRFQPWETAEPATILGWCDTPSGPRCKVASSSGRCDWYGQDAIGFPLTEGEVPA